MICRLLHCEGFSAHNRLLTQSAEVVACASYVGLKEIVNNDIFVTGNCYRELIEDKKVIEINLCTREENMFVNASSSKLENNKKIVQSVQDEEKDEHEIFGDSCTNGSTSKSSTEWRSSIKDSTTDDPFSSSSRRSCPKWESYTIFQKYDEEMLFFDRISAQKLHETGKSTSLNFPA